jgi:hypothetical protein
MDLELVEGVGAGGFREMMLEPRVLGVSHTVTGTTLLEFEVISSTGDRVPVRSEPGGNFLTTTTATGHPAGVFLENGQRVYSYSHATSNGRIDPWKNTSFRMVSVDRYPNFIGWVLESNLKQVVIAPINSGLLVHERVIQQPTSIGYSLGVERQFSQINHIAVHHTASTNQNPSITDVNGWWSGNNWTRSGYHFLIRGNGSIWQLVPIHARSNGVENNNTSLINISFAGIFTATNLPTQAARNSFGFLCRQLLGSSQLPNIHNVNEHIRGHRMWANTVCPGFTREQYLSWV